MRSTLRLIAVLGLGLLTLSACGKFSSPEKKQGYAMGMNYGNSIKQVADKVVLDEVFKGLKDQMDGKGALNDADLQSILGSLNQGISNDHAKTGYAIGQSLARNQKAYMDLVDMKSLVQGMKDGFEGKGKLQEKEAGEILQALSARHQEAQKAKNVGVSEKNKVEGAAFLTLNKAKAGVKTTASGLQYEVIKAGSGKKPKPENVVRVHYTGTLIDGTKFDSSVDRGEPTEFPLNRVIPGWTEGLQLMNVGSKYRFTIPSEIAYGPNGAGDKIGPDAVLIFDVELIKIIK